MESYYLSPKLKNTQKKTHFPAGNPPENLPESSISDCESGITGSSPSFHPRRPRESFREELAVELNEGERIYEVIHQKFRSCLGTIGNRTMVESIYRRNWSEISTHAKLQSFQIQSRALADKNGGNSNVKFGWYGDCKEKIEHIISYGFSHLDIQNNNNGAVNLSPDYSPIESVERSIPDEEGVRHILLCRVILGQSELVESGSSQTHPSSKEFDSGVDDLQNPNKYIIWSTHMNSHILPEYIVSFKASAPTSPILKGCLRMEKERKMKMPGSPWVSFPALIKVLANFLHGNSICLIYKHHKEYTERKITRAELIQKVRQIAGDELLVAVIKSCRGVKAGT